MVGKFYEQGGATEADAAQVWRESVKQSAKKRHKARKQ